ncbi:MAG: type II toxin-antitoxin system RelE/ParE family toxin [Nitrospirota bacterium]
MKYRLIYTEKAFKDIKKLDPVSKKRLGDTLNRYKQDPLIHARELTDPQLGTYRFRVGDLRVIFDLHGGDIVILRVGHRKSIYRG